MSAPGSAAGERRMVASKIFQLGQFVSDTVAERAQLAVINVDPRARLQIQRPQRQLLVDTSLTADAVADSLVRAGLRVQSWAAEVPVHDGVARLSLRSRAEMSR